MQPMKLMATGLLFCAAACSSATETSVNLGPADAAVEAQAVPLSERASLTEIAVYQVVKVDVMRDGAPVTTANAPLVPKRAGLIRAYVAVIPKAWRARKLIAELHLFLPQGERIITDERLIASSSDDDTLDSTFVFPFDAAVFTKAGAIPYYLLVTDPKLAASGDDIATLRYPAGNDTELIRIDKSPGELKLHIVPFRYDTDGSMRLPRTQPSTLAAIKTQMMDMYPASDVTVEVGPTVPWSEPILADGTGWDSVLQATLDQRALDGPTSEVYYIGLFSPTATFGQYCKSGCILGLAPLADAFSPQARGSAVVGFGGYETTETSAHEIGHTMGRSHAPCGHPAGIDPKYPYADGSVGVSGFRASDASLISAGASDMMSYCPPEWISDYTYKGLFTRMSYVNSHILSASPKLLPITRIRIDGANNILGVKSGFARDEVGSGEPIRVRFSGGGDAEVTGQLTRYDHLPGGTIVAPEAPRWATAVSLPERSTRAFAWRR